MTNTLKQAKEAFNEWHSLGEKRGYASKSLKQMACNLLSRYDYSRLSYELGIPIKTLQNWEKALNKQSTASTTPNPYFVELPVVNELPATKIPPPKNIAPLRLTLINGTELIIPEDCSERTVKLICAIVKEVK